MKKINLFPETRKFQRDKKRRYIKKYRFYPFFLYFRLDKWLKKMSLNGWHIVDCGICSFSFEQGEPMEKEYFTYSNGAVHRNEGVFSIPLRYPFLDSTYGVKKKRSKINANESKAYQIVEIDTEKIDIIHDIGYKELVRDRNKLYTLKAFVNFGIVAVIFILSVLLLIFG